MRKSIQVINVIFLVSALFLTFLAPPKAKAEEEVIGAHCYPSNPNNSYYIWTFAPIHQPFVTTHNTITKMSFYLRGTGKVKFKLRETHITYFEDIYSTTITSSSSTGKWVEVKFSTPTKVIKSHWYWIEMRADPGVLVSWVYGDTSCYSFYGSGNAMYGESHYYHDFNADFGFAEYGYDATDTAAIPEDDTDKTKDAVAEKEYIYGVERSGPASSKYINANIKAPTSVKAVSQKQEDKSAVKITWEKSATKDVDGYIVFRKTKGKDYKSIIQVKNDAASYLDSEVDVGQSYTYMLRAYKEKYESPNSNEAKIEVKNQAKISPVDIDEMSYTDPIMIVFYIIAGCSILICILFYIKSKNRPKNEQKQTN